MDGKNIELSRRRVLGGIVTVGVAGAATGAGTFAFFSDEETSEGNTITAGTLELQEISTATVDVDNVIPGDSVGPDTIEATYDASSSVDPVEVTFEFDITADADGLAGALDVDTAELTRNGVTENDLTGTESVSTVSDLDGITLQDAFGDVEPGDSVALELESTFTDTGTEQNELQGAEVEFNVTFEAIQPTN